MDDTNSLENSRDYDVVLYGAGGFVGRQTVAYFANAAPQHRLRWAIAGRSREKLEAARAQAGAPDTVDILLADGRDEAAVDAIASRTRVLLSTAGPFALYSDAIVSACVRRRTHYVDITGETPWVRSLIDRHHAAATADGTRIVPCCGFDSVPSDLGVLLAVRRLQQISAAPCRQANGYFQLRGGVNGGTVASALLLYQAGPAEQARDPFLLSPDIVRTSEDVARNLDPTSTHFDADVNAWVGPFVMGPCNTRVVRRSAALFNQWGASYGPDFAYQEYARYGGRLARARAGMTTGALAVMTKGIRRSVVRKLVRPFLPSPGSGPSGSRINDGWFRCEVVATAEDNRQVRVRMTHQGDPGNRATTRFVCESALSLAADPDLRPGAPRRGRGGVLTPATAFGQQLAERLPPVGLTIDVRS